MTKGGPAPESLDPERRSAAAEGADAALTAYLAQAGENAPKSVGLTRRIALATLFLHLRAHIAIRDALDAATDINAGRPGLSDNYLRKSKSEARAVIQALASSQALPATQLEPNAFFERLESLLDAMSFDQANRNRAFALRGTRGGRRPKQRPQLVLQGLIRLKRRADRGDVSALDELSAIRKLLNAWDADV